MATPSSYSEVVESLLSDLMSNQEEFQDLLNELAYEGFNVAQFFKLLNQKQPSQKELIKDMKVAIMCFLSRGNSFSKILERMSDNGKATLMKIKKTYGIVDNVGRGGKNAVTLSRIAACFPQLTSNLLYSLDIPRPFLINNKVANFPRVLTYSGSASVLNSGQTNGIIAIKSLLYYLLYENMVINARKPNPPGLNHEDLQTIVPYVQASYTSDTISKSKRNNLMVSYGLTDNSSPIVNAMVTAAADLDKIHVLNIKGLFPEIM